MINHDKPSNLGHALFSDISNWPYPARKWEIWVWPWVAIITFNCFGDSCSLRAPHFGTETYIHRIHVSRGLGWRCWGIPFWPSLLGYEEPWFFRWTMVLLNYWDHQPLQKCQPAFSEPSSYPRAQNPPLPRAARFPMQGRPHKSKLGD